MRNVASPVHRVRGLTIIEVLAIACAITALLAIVLPALARGRGESGLTVSMSNLAAINTAFGAYASDFNGRQPTAIVDNFSTYGLDGPAAVTNYVVVNGVAHPPVILGQCQGGTWGFYMPPAPGASFNYITIVPIVFPSVPNTGFGNFRIPNAQSLHTYVGGGFYRSAFYAPNDAGIFANVEPWFDHECEYVSSQWTGGRTIFSSYCTSPAAMFDPDVLRPVAAGGYRNPYSYADGFRSPSVSQATFPDLKTRMLEYYWLQPAPENPCNSFFVVGAAEICEPWFFNHSATSSPATLFFDGSVRQLPNSEVLAADAAVLTQTGEGLWHRGTPFGANGFYGNFSLDGTIVSHHILTTGGITGRDTTARSR